MDFYFFWNFFGNFENFFSNQIFYYLWFFFNSSLYFVCNFSNFLVKSIKLSIIEYFHWAIDLLIDYKYFVVVLLCSFYDVFPAAAPREGTVEFAALSELYPNLKPGIGRSQLLQAGFQLIALASSILIATVSGSVCGELMWKFCQRIFESINQSIKRNEISYWNSEKFCENPCLKMNIRCQEVQRADTQKSCSYSTKWRNGSKCPETHR